MSVAVKQHEIAIITGSDLVIYGLQTLLRSAFYNFEIFPNIDMFLKSKMPVTILFLYDTLENEYDLKQNIHYLQNKSPDTQIIILSARSDCVYIWDIVDSGAGGFLCLQDNICQRILLFLEEYPTEVPLLSPTAQRALSELHHYKAHRLTDYQLRVLHGLVNNKTTLQMSKDLNRSMGSVYQMQYILRTIFNVRTNQELIQKVTDMRLFQA